MKKGKMMKRDFFSPKRKKQQITIATEDAHSSILVWSKSIAFLPKNLYYLNYLNAFKPVISIPVISK